MEHGLKNTAADELGGQVADVSSVVKQEVCFTGCMKVQRTKY